MTNSNYAITKCFLPQETTVMYTYIVGVTLTVLWFLCPRKLLLYHRSAKRSWWRCMKVCWDLACLFVMMDGIVKTRREITEFCVLTHWMKRAMRLSHYVLICCLQRILINFRRFALAFVCRSNKLCELSIWQVTLYVSHYLIWASAEACRLTCELSLVYIPSVLCLLPIDSGRTWCTCMMLLLLLLLI